MMKNDNDDLTSKEMSIEAFTLKRSFPSVLPPSQAGIDNLVAAIFRHNIAKVLSAVHLPVVCIADDGIIVAASKSFAQLCNRTTETLTGEKILDVVTGEKNQSEVIQMLEQIDALGSAEHKEVSFNTSTEVLHYVFTGVKLEQADGSSMGKIILLENVNRIRNLEAQLAHSERLASLGQLSASIAHELNNPLTSIMMSAQYLLNKLETQRTQNPDGTFTVTASDAEKIKAILQAAERAQNFSREVVGFARPSHEEHLPLNLAEVIHESVMFCSHLYQNIDVQYALPAHLPYTGARSQLNQVFVNLITNACQSMPEGGSLTFSAEETLDHLCIRITDTGLGIYPANLKKIFEPFFTTKPRGEGTGLGLPIVKKILDQHKSEITFESVPGRTTATICFLKASSTT